MTDGILYQLDKRVDEGLINRQYHASLPLIVYSYSDRCMHDRAWDKFTSMARGLVVHKSGDIVAKVMPKFFNHGEPSCPDVPNLPYQIFEKIDGSMLNSWTYEGKRHFSTKGSFDNIWIQEAEKHRRLYKNFPDHWTVVGEIVLPVGDDELERAVKHEPGIYLLAGVDNYSGKDLSWETLTDAWNGFLPKVCNSDLNMLQKWCRDVEDTEGWVVRFSNGLRIKFKTIWYVKIFRVINQLDKRVKLGMMEGMSLREITREVPEELHDAARIIFRDLTRKIRVEENYLLDICLRIWKDDKLEFVKEAQKYGDESGLLIALYDNKPITEKLLKRI